MSRYDFKSLSPQDFEELTRDILQAEWGVALEAFKAGRDQGIDLRYSRLETGTTVIQCKHYASSTFSKLLSHLKDSELPKVQRLKPRRYVVVTSLALSPAEKDKIVAAMCPFVLTAKDVLGAGDLDGLLARHEAIERANFKLWLTNTSVIERILHNAEVCQTLFEVDRIRKKLPVFVQSQAYPRARQILDEQRVVILSGVPGIGKTTLAELLLFAHLDDCYEPVVIQTDIAEGKRLFRPERKQIFYYDDFLGQTFLGDRHSYVGRNYDSALLSFMEMIRGSSHSRFLLTTREHILRQAIQASERFQHSSVLSHRCVLEIGDYTFGQRARILYNHLYFSDLPQAHKEAVLRDDFFLQIIRHEHFNPRLIEWLSSITRLSSPPADQFCKSISDLLRSPERLWSHAFKCQISDSARDLLLTLYSLGDWVDLEDLEPAFEAIHRGACRRYNRPRNVGDFRSALQELDAAFLSYSSGKASFLNPSIRGFVAGVFCEMPTLALQVMTDAVRFSQLSKLWELSVEQGATLLNVALRAHAQDFRAHIERLMFMESMRWAQTRHGRLGYFFDTEEEWRLGNIVEWAEALKDETFVDLARAYSAFLLKRWHVQSLNFLAATVVLETIKESTWFLAHGGTKHYRTILDGVLSHVDEAWAEDWIYLLELPSHNLVWTKSDGDFLSAALHEYRHTGVNDERYNCSDIGALNELRATLNVLDEKFNVGFSSTIALIDAEIEEHEECAPYDGEGGGFSRTSPHEQLDPVSEEDVREMFNTLRDLNGRPSKV